MSESSPSISESLGDTSSLHSVIDHHRAAHVASREGPLWQNPLAGRVAAALYGCLPTTVVIALPDDVIRKTIMQLVSVLQSQPSGHSPTHLQREVDQLLREVAKDEEQITQLHTTCSLMSEALHEKELQKREKEVQLMAAQGEIATLRSQLSQAQAAVGSLERLTERLREEAVRSARQSPPPETLTEPSRPASGSEDVAAMLTQRLLMAEEECSRLMQLLEKYRQLAHAKDEELCHQTAAVEARVQTVQQQFEQRLQAIHRDSALKTTAMSEELDLRRSQMEDLRRENLALRAEVPTAAYFAANEGQSRAPGDALTRPPDGSFAARRRSPVTAVAVGSNPKSSSPGLNPCGGGHSPGSGELPVIPLRPTSRSNSVAFSLSSLSDSGTYRDDMHDASTQVDVGALVPAPEAQGNPAPCGLEPTVVAKSGEPRGSVTASRRSSGGLVGYRNCQLGDVPTLRGPIRATPTEELSPRSRALAAMPRLRLTLSRLDAPDLAPAKGGPAAGKPRPTRTGSSSARSTPPPSEGPSSARSNPGPRRPSLTSVTAPPSTTVRKPGSRLRSSTTGTESVRPLGSRPVLTAAPRTSLRPTPTPASGTPAKEEGVVKSPAGSLPGASPAPDHPPLANGPPGSTSRTSARPALAGPFPRKSSVRSNSQPLVPSVLQGHLLI